MVYSIIDSYDGDAPIHTSYGRHSVYSTSSLEDAKPFNFDMLSISSSVTDKAKFPDAPANAPTSKNSAFSLASPRFYIAEIKEGKISEGAHDNSYENITDSIFSNNDNIINSYHDDTEIESVPSTVSAHSERKIAITPTDIIQDDNFFVDNINNMPHYEVKIKNDDDIEVRELKKQVPAPTSPAAEDASECYSFIIDLIYDYDTEGASVISGQSGLSPAAIDTVLDSFSSSKTKPLINARHKPLGRESSTAKISDGQKQRKHSIKRAQIKSFNDFEKSEAHYKQPQGSPKHQPSQSPQHARTGAAPQQPDPIWKQSTVAHLNDLGIQNAFSDAYRNDFTVPVPVMNKDAFPAAGNSNEKKSFKYRVVVTKNNIIKNVKRLSKNLSRKSVNTNDHVNAQFPKTPREQAIFMGASSADYNAHKSVFANNKLVHAIKAVITKVNTPGLESGTYFGRSNLSYRTTQPIETHNYGGKASAVSCNLLVSKKNNSVTRNPTSFSSIFGDKVKLKRSKTANSAALTRLSGNYERVSGTDLQFKHANAPPARKINGSNAKAKNKNEPAHWELQKSDFVRNKRSSDIQIKKRSILVKDSATDLYNLYAFDNPYLDPSTENKVEELRQSKRMSMTMSGINIKNANSPDVGLIGSSRKYIKLASDSTLIKDEDSEAYTISYDIMPSPIRRKMMQERNPSLAPISEAESSIGKLLSSSSKSPSIKMPSAKPTPLTRYGFSNSNPTGSRPHRQPTQHRSHSSSPEISKRTPRQKPRSKPRQAANEPRAPLSAYKSCQLKYSPSASKSMKRKKAAGANNTSSSSHSGKAGLQVDQLQQLAASSKIPAENSALQPPSVDKGKQVPARRGFRGNTQGTAGGASKAKPNIPVSDKVKPIRKVSLKRYNPMVPKNLVSSDDDSSLGQRKFFFA